MPPPPSIQQSTASPCKRFIANPGIVSATGDAAVLRRFDTCLESRDTGSVGRPFTHLVQRSIQWSTHLVQSSIHTHKNVSALKKRDFNEVLKNLTRGLRGGETCERKMSCEMDAASRPKRQRVT